MKDSTRKAAIKTIIGAFLFMVLWAILWALGAIHTSVAYSSTV